MRFTNTPPPILQIKGQRAPRLLESHKTGDARCDLGTPATDPNCRHPFLYLNFSRRLAGDYGPSLMPKDPGSETGTVLLSMAPPCPLLSFSQARRT